VQEAVCCEETDVSRQGREGRYPLSPVGENARTTKQNPSDGPSPVHCHLARHVTLLPPALRPSPHHLLHLNLAQHFPHS
jgi:hypothetical protein